MIIFHSPRSYLSILYNVFFKYINLHKESKLQEYAYQAQREISDGYLNAMVLNSLLNDVEEYLQKKLVNTSNPVVKLKLSKAHAICLFKTLMILPIEADKEFEQIVRQDFITKLYPQLL
ncbi:MAG: hypothetical protein V4722_04400 [Bacteroidota bacterium]